MSRRIPFKQTVRKIVAPQFAPLGYELIDEQTRGTAICHFRKHLFGDVYGFIEFFVNPFSYVMREREFRVSLLRHRCEEFRYGPRKDYENYLHMSLVYLMTAGYRVPVSRDLHLHDGWSYSTLEELKSQLQDATQKIIQYAIPWLEDPETKNPELLSPPML